MHLPFSERSLASMPRLPRELKRDIPITEEYGVIVIELHDDRDRVEPMVNTKINRK